MLVDLHLADDSFWLCAVIGLRKHMTSDTNMRCPPGFSVSHQDVPADPFDITIACGRVDEHQS